MCGRVPTDTADAYYESTVPALVPGFRRTTRRRELSEDKSALTVTIVDEQMPPHVPPFAIVTASVEHTYASQVGSYGFKWNGSFSAAYQVARRDGTVFDAITDFLDIAKDRITEAAKMKLAGGVGVPGAGSSGAPLAHW
jgi:hypothetical protein